MKIIALTENTSNNPQIGFEHGLSLFIATKTLNILFDMGQSNLFAKNVQYWGIDLAKVDFAVISHGHYDYGGGLKEFLQINQTAPIYINKHAFEAHYNETEKYIGLNNDLRKNNRLIFSDNKYEIEKAITLFSCNDKKRKYDFGYSNLNKFEQGTFIPEDFRHEHYLLLEENGKKILISRCSHKGILNIEEWFIPDVLIGGFHFMKIESEQILKDYAEKLNSYPTDFYTCHCTGEKQFDFMKTYINNLHYLSAGTIIEIQ